MLVQLAIRNEESQQMTEATERCKARSASVFSPNIDRLIWRQFAQQKGLLPATCDESTHVRLINDIGVERDAQVREGQYDFLEPPWEIRGGQCVAKASNVILDISDETLPRSKYAALFDSRNCFDDLRLSFLKQVCGHKLEDLIAQWRQADFQHGTAKMISKTYLISYLTSGKL